MSNEFTHGMGAQPAPATNVAPDGGELILRLPKREDRDYEIESVSKARLIIETLVEEQPITEKNLAVKLGFKKDLVMRTLRTYRLGGWVVRDDKTLQWRVDRRLVRLAVDIQNSRAA